MVHGLWSITWRFVIIISFAVCRVKTLSTCGDTCECSVSKTSIDFLYMTSFGEAFNVAGSIIGMMMATEVINSNDTILSGYTLSHTDVVDSQCDRTTSLMHFLDEISRPCPGFIAVIGSGCSVATEPVAETSHHWGLSMISYASSAVNLRNRHKFPNYFQLYSPDESFIMAIMSTIKFFNWKQVGIVTQNEKLFTEGEEILRDILNEINVTLLLSSSFDSDENPADNPMIFAENAHIFFLNAYENKARQVACAAYQRGLYGKYYSWIFVGWYDYQWWMQESDDLHPFNCTVEQMEEFVNYSLIVQQYPINDMRDKEVIGGYSYNSFIEEYNKRINNNSIYNHSYTAHIAYDATWTLALALDKVERKLSSGDIGDCPNPTNITKLYDFKYFRNSTVACLIRSELTKTSFEGLTGTVQFDNDGIRMTSLSPIRIYQIRNDSVFLIAKWNGFIDSEVTYIGRFNENIVFPYGIPPDGTPERNISFFHISLIVILYTLASVGLVFCLVCFIFTIVFRKKRIVRLTSPNLDYIIIAGLAMTFISVYFRAYPKPVDDESTVIIVPLFCGITSSLDFIAYTLTFGTILCKMWRIYYIFHNPSPNKKMLSDYHLIAMVCFITAPMVVLLIIRFAIPYTRPKAILDVDSEHPAGFDERNVYQEFFLYKCSNFNYSIIWRILSFLYFGVLQIIALVLAVQTRKVRIKILNDSKEVTAIIYITSVVFIGVMIASFSLSNYLNIQEALLNTGLLIGSYSTVLIIFIPKMTRVYKEINGTSKVYVFSKVEMKKNGAIVVKNDKEKIAELESELSKLKAQIDSNKEISSMMRKLSLENYEIKFPSAPATCQNNCHFSSNEIQEVKCYFTQDDDTGTMGAETETTNDKSLSSDNAVTIEINSTS